MKSVTFCNSSRYFQQIPSSQNNFAILGRLFVTSQGIYFTSFLRLKLRIFINFSEVEFLKKHQVMVVFPTAILICKKDGTNTVFASFRARDKSLALINHYFQCFQKDPMFFHNNRELFLKELTRNYGNYENTYLHK